MSVWYEQPKQVCDGLMKVRRDLFAPVAHKLGWDFNSTDDYLTNILRVLAITNAGRSDDPSIVNESKKRFWAFVKGDNEALHPNLRGPVYNIVLGAAEDEAEEEKMWEHILDIYRDESLPTDQRLIALNALGGVKSHTLLYRYLDMSMDEKEIRGQDCLYVYSSLGSNPAAHKLFWEFFTSNYFVLYAKFSKSMKLFVTALRAAVGGFVTSGQIEEAEEFFKDKDTRQYARFLQQALEGARVNTKWVERDQALVAQWIGQSVKDEHQL